MKAPETPEEFQLAAQRVSTPAQAAALLDQAFAWNPQEDWQDENEAIETVLRSLGTLNEAILLKLWERATPFLSTLWENPHMDPEAARILAQQASTRLARARNPGDVAAVLEGAYERGIFQARDAVTRTLWKCYRNADETEDMDEDQLLMARALARCPGLSTQQLLQIVQRLPDHEGASTLRALADHPSADLSIWGEILECGGFSDRVEAVAHIPSLHRIPQYRVDMEQEARNEMGVLIRAALTRSPGIRTRFHKICLFSARIASEALESTEFQRAVFPFLHREDLLPLLEHEEADVRLRALLAAPRLEPASQENPSTAPLPRARG